ncbi:hypothetical protein FCULG_00012853 [Fusarium culmorum]|uniref:Uncharacterized protein n=1 Tax=Fusarium culmorum TaxID=5516 RepID=A0A2T4GFV1_FUSCU|nr:hypothetical protein FCULG_00012853 [Fusarium culmorum]
MSVITFKILCESENEKKALSIRSLPGPLQDTTSLATNIIESVGNVANYATTLEVQATRVAGDVKDKASSAIASAETFATGFIPKGCSFGTKYMCIDPNNGPSKCTAFPIDHKAPWDQLSSFSDTMKPVKEILENNLSLQSFLISGTVSSMVATSLSYANPVRFPFKTSIAAIFGLLASALFAALFGVVITIHTAGKALAKAKAGTFESGFVYEGSIATFILSLLQLVMILLEFCPFL